MSDQEPTLTSIAETIHNISTSKGFDPPSMENLPQKLMLSVSELAEAMEEHRKGRGLRYYMCEVCGAKRNHPEEEGESHYMSSSRPLGKFRCLGQIKKPEGILPELADSIIRNLHMMHSIIERNFEFQATVGEVIVEKVRFNDTRPQMHGGNSY